MKLSWKEARDNLGRIWTRGERARMSAKAIEQGLHKPSGQILGRVMDVSISGMRLRVQRKGYASASWYHPSFWEKEY